MRAFEEESGYNLEVRQSGDAGALTTKLVLTADNPTGDVAFGVDNTFASRALDEDVFAESRRRAAGGRRAVRPRPATTAALVPVDNGNVCVNVDTTWFAERDLEPPATLEDLTDPAYDDLFVTAVGPVQLGRAWRSCSAPSPSTATTGRPTGSG